MKTVQTNHKHLVRKHLSRPTVPFEVSPKDSVAATLRKMGQTSFQGRSLATAFEIWLDMLKDDTTIFLGVSGAMTAGGMKSIVRYLIENRFIDCLVSTGANLFHDIYESFGSRHYQGSPAADDVELKDLWIDRVYDTYCSELTFRRIDSWVGQFAYGRLDVSRPYTTREFFYLLGGEVARRSKVEGMLTSAHNAKVPVYSPAVGDSSVGIGIATYQENAFQRFQFDVIGDVQETAYIAARSPNTGVIYLGGGTPKNFIQQAEVTASIHMGMEAPGHKYAVQITADAPHWGGLSGCTFEEAQSWGKIHKKARMATVYADVTVGLPIIAQALAQEGLKYARRRKKPVFEMGQKLSMRFK